jgi:hypothetical protein
MNLPFHSRPALRAFRSSFISAPDRTHVLTNRKARFPTNLHGNQLPDISNWNSPFFIRIYPEARLSRLTRNLQFITSCCPGPPSQHEMPVPLAAIIACRSLYQVEPLALVSAQLIQVALVQTRLGTEKTNSSLVHLQTLYPSDTGDFRVVAWPLASSGAGAHQGG